MPNTVGIIGAGIGGLVAAAYLARAGYQVTIYEKATTAGGSGGYYHRHHRIIPTGATIAFGLEEGGVLSGILDELGVDVPVRKLSYPMDILLPDRTVALYQDRLQWETELRRSFPEQANAVIAFWRELSKIAAGVLAVTQARPSLPATRIYQLGGLPKLIATRPFQLLGLARYSLMTVEDLLRKHRLETFEPFRFLLNAQLVDAAQTDVREAALLPSSLALDIYRVGSFAIKGGFATLVQALQKRIEAWGGRVLLATPVHRMRYDQLRGKWSLDLRRSTEEVDILINAAGYIPGADQSSETGQKQHRIQDREGNQQSAWGAFRIDALLREEALASLAVKKELEDLPFAFQIVPEPSHSTLFGDEHGPVYITLHPSVDKDGNEVEGEILLTVSIHTKPDLWASLTKDEYAARKKEFQSAIETEINKVLPDYEKHLIHADGGSPLTYKRYLGKTAVGGFPLTVRNSILQPKGSHGKQPRLYFAGETVFPGPGTLSAALSGFYAARSIMQEERS